MRGSSEGEYDDEEDSDRDMSQDCDSERDLDFEADDAQNSILVAEVVCDEANDTSRDGKYFLNRTDYFAHSESFLNFDFAHFGPVLEKEFSLRKKKFNALLAYILKILTAL